MLGSDTLTGAGTLDGMAPPTGYRQTERWVAIAESDPDWRPADHVFSDSEMRDRFMRYGGVDAATAWSMVWFIRDTVPDLDLHGVFAATEMGHAVLPELSPA